MLIFARKAIALMKDQKMPKHDSARLERRVEKLMAGHREEVDSGDGSGFEAKGSKIQRLFLTNSFSFIVLLFLFDSINVLRSLAMSAFY